MLLVVLLACRGESASPSPSDVIPVRVDRGRTHQTLLGFGAFGGQRPPWGEGPVSSPAFVDRVVDDLGLSLLRVEVPTSLEPSNENPDPAHADLERFNLHDPRPGEHDPLGSHLEYLRQLRAAGVETLIAAVWSPPPWMKHNGRVGNGTRRNSAPGYAAEPDLLTNQLRRDHYDEFAEFCAAYVRLVERETGVTVTALSVQNEPRFSQWYPSAVLDGEALRDLVRAVGRRFEREGLTTRLLVPEDTGNFDAMRSMAAPTLADAETRAHISALSVHGYAQDGATPTPRSTATWRAMAEWSDAHDLPLWVTEASGFSRDWAGAMRMASAIDTALRHGNASVWAYFKLGDTGPEEDALIHDQGRRPTALYDAARHYFRFVRPGAVRVATDVEADRVLAVAFENAERGPLVVVLVNPSREPTLVDLEGAGLPSRFEGIQSDETLRGVGVAPVEARRFSLPPRSITTLREVSP